MSQAGIAQRYGARAKIKISERKLKRLLRMLGLEVCDQRKHLKSQVGVFNAL